MCLAANRVASPAPRRKSVLPVSGTGTPVLQSGAVIILLSRVTAPLRASKRPSTVAPVIAVMDVKARMFPAKSVPVPRVAELPTWKKTLQALAPLSRVTILLEAVMNVEPIWKIKTELGFPWPSSVRFPVRKTELVPM